MDACDRAEFRVWHQDEETDYIMFDTRVGSQRLQQNPLTAMTMDCQCHASHHPGFAA